MENYWVNPPPPVIGGGMGVNVSWYGLVKILARLGQLGTLSGVALDRVVAYELLSGDPTGDIRRALEHFPDQRLVKEVLDAFFNEHPSKIKRHIPVFTVKPSHLLISLTICANYAVVWLAKEGHDNPVSINYLEKVSMPLMYGILGAMLAGVDFVTMGAGLALQIPKLFEDILAGRTATYHIPVIGRKEKYVMEFDPIKFFGPEFHILRKTLKRPGLIPIISSLLGAKIFKAKLPPGNVQAIVYEDLETAGGHGPFPRGRQFKSNGEPLCDARDETNFEELSDLFEIWYYAGGVASPQGLAWARALGATGIQVGSILAVSNDSKMDEKLKRLVRYLGYLGLIEVYNDPYFSSTGYPFKKVKNLKGTITDEQVYLARKRICNHKCLVNLFEKPNGTIGYRCSAEPIKAYLSKGGALGDTINRGCLCEGLLSTCGADPTKPSLVTLGKNVDFLRDPALMENPYDSYSAEQAINYLLS